MRTHATHARRLWAIVPFVLAASCTTAGDRFADSAAGAIAESAAAASAAAGTTSGSPAGAAGAGSPGGGAASAGAARNDSTPEMNADAMRTPNGSVAVRAPAVDSNQAFLRAMTDHHHGLVALVDSAMPKLGAARADADTLQQHQRRQRDDMLQMLNTEYDDPIKPAIMPSSTTMIGTVARAAAGGADRTFYQQVIAHHRAGVSMIDRQLPHLSGRPKAMATTMRTAHTREIAAFERKAGGSR